MSTSKQPIASHLKISEGRCQFCHHAGSDIKQLIAGDSAFICSDCVQACAALLHPVTAEQQGAQAERYLYQRLKRHFAPMRAQELIATSRTYPLRQQADLQRALDDLFGERRIPENFVGVHQEYSHQALGFSKLINQSRNAIEAAPAQYEDVEIGADETVHCLKNGLWLLRDELGPYAVVLAQHDDYGRGGDLIVEIAAPPGEGGVQLATHVFTALEKRLSTDSCYRERVLSLEQRYQVGGHVPRICVHDFGAVEREDVILPEATLRAMERNVVDFAKQRAALRELGLSTQKGLLFHGPPGTGKTHCIRYLAGRLKGHTTLLI
ncbi:MAG: cell division protein FtsH, partial [Acidobacteria bacterium]|nr:cell division protein FtsH [Acidobacteriota bacterium]